MSFQPFSWIHVSLSACLVLGLFAAMAGGREIVAPLRGQKRHLWLLVAVVLLGALLRAVIAPAAPMNISEFDRVNAADEFFERYPSADQSYFEASTSFLRLLFSVIGGTPRIEPVFPVMIVLGILSIPLLFLLAAHLFRSLWVAQGAALLLAVSVAPVRFSASANTATLMVFALLAALVCLVAYTASRDSALLLAGGLLIVFAALTHGEARLIAPAAAVLVIARLPLDEWRRPRFWLVIALVVVVSLPALKILTSSQSAQTLHRLPTRFELGEWLVRFRSTLFASSTDSPVLSWAAIAGALIALVTRRWVALATCVLWMAGLYLGFLLGGQREANVPFGEVRYMLGWLPALYMLAATVPALVIERGGWPAVLGGVLLVGEASAQVGHAGSERYQQLFNDQREYRFLSRAMSALPPGTTVWLPSHRPGCFHYAEEFAFMAGVLRPELQVQTGVSAGQEKPALPNLLHVKDTLAPWPPENADGAMVYLGLYCADGQNHVPFWRPECQALRDRYELEPVSVDTIPNRPFRICPFEEYYKDFVEHPPAPGQVQGDITLGFYRLHARK